MTKQKKLEIYNNIKGLILRMEEADVIDLFAPNGEDNFIWCFERGNLWEINGYPMTHVPEIVALLTRDVLAYWGQNPEEAKSSGLI